MDPGIRLARRLRDLREQAPSGRITQGVLATAMGVTAQSVSSWEREEKVTVIPQGHLRSYAQFFAADRQTDGRRRLIALSELTDDERQRFEELHSELDELRTAALDQATIARGDVEPVTPMFPGLRDRFWRFRKNRPITIVCAGLPESHLGRSPFTDPRDPDFAAAYTYSDPGAVMEIYGHIRAVNPESDVKIRPSWSEMMSDDYTDHLVLLGGVDFNHVTQAVMRMIDIPVEQVSRETPGDPGVFHVHDGETFAPYIDADRGTRTLIRDVAHFYRGPNPYNKFRTVTICNGMFGRGVEGAVKATTDPKFRDRNAEYVRSRLEDGGSVSLLFWVAITGGTPVTPDWTQEGTVLHESPPVPER